MRSSVADRERSIDVLKQSFVEGRLTRDELDERLGQVLISRAFEDLMALTADLPVGPFGRLPIHPSTPPFPRTSQVLGVALVLVWCAALVATAAIMLST